MEICVEFDQNTKTVTNRDNYEEIMQWWQERDDRLADIHVSSSQSLTEESRIEKAKSVKVSKVKLRGNIIFWEENGNQMQKEINAICLDEAQCFIYLVYRTSTFSQNEKSDFCYYYFHYYQ
ncbi:MAG: hypothetical protein BRC33_04175 [Cyanobacteria bacterium SW_9_44_58]|nr:MAG: hypothetical protein BRC33_04175 [Cyanobacteria bacterium SW_9_44_58]